MSPWQPSSLRRLFAAPITQAILILGLTQIVTWGTTFYALGVLAAPIINDTGWSRSVVFGGLTLSLLASAMVSTWIGRLIDRHGARHVMALGSIAIASGLAWLALAQSQLSYLAAWCLLGPAMRMTLYDAAFAALVQIRPEQGRRAISYLTLFGGFASTIFWPLGHALATATDWRMTLAIFAALNLALCLPLHWWGLANRQSTAAAAGAGAATDEAACASAVASTAATDTAGTAGAAAAAETEPDAQNYGLLSGTARTRAMRALSIMTFASGFIFGTLAVHMVNLISASGLTIGAAVLITSFKGVAQVAGRLCDIAFARYLNPLMLGRISLVLIMLALLILLNELLRSSASFTMALVFTLVIGSGQGIFTIARGTIPLVLFGATGYGEILGRLAVPMALSNALAPAAFALIIDNWGVQSGELVLLGAAIVAMIAMQFLLVNAGPGRAKVVRPAEPK